MDTECDEVWLQQETIGWAEQLYRLSTQHSENFKKTRHCLTFIMFWSKNTLGKPLTIVSSYTPKIVNVPISCTGVALRDLAEFSWDSNLAQNVPGTEVCIVKEPGRKPHAPCDASIQRREMLHDMTDVVQVVVQYSLSGRDGVGGWLRAFMRAKISATPCD